MELEYAQPEKGQEPYIRHLASQDVLSLMGLNNVNSVVAIDEVNGTRIPVAMMIGRWDAEERSMDVVWLFVEEEYRGDGIAKKFLNMLSQAAETIQATKLRASFYPDFAGQEETEKLISFLDYNGFEVEEREDGPWMITGQDFLETDFVVKAEGKAQKNRDETVPLGNFSMAEIGRCLIQFAPGEVYPREFVDTEVSRGILDEEGWKGILVVCLHGDVYEPVIFHAANKQAEMALLVGMANALAEKMEPTDYFRVHKNPTEFSSWMEKIFPGAERQGLVVGEKEVLG